MNADVIGERRIEFYPDDNVTGLTPPGDDAEWKARESGTDTGTWGSGETPMAAVRDYYEKVLAGKIGAGHPPEMLHREHFTRFQFSRASDGGVIIEEVESENGTQARGDSVEAAIVAYCKALQGGDGGD